ncbi:MAG: sigma-54-dependent Fis family transcriptional regulator [Candidatus Schekmanbacteria bacterium]|nr:sigma-54-dependent Fis family transcriptional regulator [Candidatus Schekmanbacteria bacterium]
MSISVLVIDNDKSVRELFVKKMGNLGYKVDAAASGEEGVLMAKHNEYGLVFTDICEKSPGYQIVELLKAEQPATPVIVVTEPNCVDNAVDAIKAGAYDFVFKPLDFGHIEIVTSRCLEKKNLEDQENKLKDIAQNLNEVVSEKYHYDKIIGKNHKLQEIYRLVNSLRDIDSTILVTGETGTGKGLLAHTIHYNSNRSAAPFVTVDCGAIPETLLESELFGHEKGSFTGALRRRIGKFEQANKGTIFMDEIGDITLTVQQKLLRVLQERKIERIGGNQTLDIDVRVIAATNKDVRKMIDEGTFREDLYYRLNIIPIHLPPLRERMDDLLLLVTHFLEKYREKLKKDVRTISQDAVNAMLRYHWPGNIRELENLMERAVIMAAGKDIVKIDIPGERRNKDIYSFGKIDINSPLKDVKREIVAQVEKKYLRELLKSCHGSINLVATRAEIDNKTLYEKMKEYDIKKEEFKHPGDED